MTRPTYTVGFAKTYDDYLSRLSPGEFKKKGADPSDDNYSGGIVFKTLQEAHKFAVANAYAVYELDADWEEDTSPPPEDDDFDWPENSRALQVDSVILRKVPLSEIEG